MKTSWFWAGGAPLLPVHAFPALCLSLSRQHESIFEAQGPSCWLMPVVEIIQFRSMFPFYYHPTLLILIEAFEPINEDMLLEVLTLKDW